MWINKKVTKMINRDEMSVEERIEFANDLIIVADERIEIANEMIEAAREMINFANEKIEIAELKMKIANTFIQKLIAKMETDDELLEGYSATYEIMGCTKEEWEKLSSLLDYCLSCNTYKVIQI